MTFVFLSCEGRVEEGEAFLEILLSVDMPAASSYSHFLFLQALFFAVLVLPNLCSFHIIYAFVCLF